MNYRGYDITYSPEHGDYQIHESGVFVGSQQTEEHARGFVDDCLEDSSMTDTQSTECFLIDPADFDARFTPGAMWFVEGGHVAVRLPDGNVFIPKMQGDVWAVTGDAPRLTVTPSIDSGTYHGWLAHGVLSSDLAGRTYA